MNKEKVLSLQDVTMRFGPKQVLNGVNLEVYKGQIIGYIGPNGAGKSTTVKIMLGLIEGYEGKIEIFGEEIGNGNGDVSYKRKIGYVPETAELYDNLTACEYLTFTGELYGLNAKEAESKALQLMKEFELESVFYQRLSSFSKGMRQKVLIISSLLHDPELLFLDEPLSGLDANSVMVIKEILDQLAARGKTIFYSSHIMDVVEKISNRIILLVDGRVVADGTFSELQEQSKEGTLEEIFNQITGFSEHKKIAEKFVEIVSEENAHG
ncbi:ABC transporter ATP-binding protein [Psychrobacillus sp. NPDC096389]|uniref:ABC transporter ATP-binding protein n=1 Tax=Psychrobacillus sp. NPDC096389 TaxID=3364490 RepID=UPI0037F82C96